MDGPSCEEYCSTYLTNCSGVSEYADMTACLDYCEDVAMWELGTEGATSGNTVACRTYHGGAPAAGDPTTHCPHAGPSGGGVCGSYCENYCQLTGQTCTGSNELYADTATCMAACSTLPATGDPGATAGDSVQCRIYHGGAPAAADAALHCPHASQYGAGVCVDSPSCEKYCHTYLTNCSGSPEHANMTACVDYCEDVANWELGTEGATSGNTVACRTYHGGAPAAGDPTTHCPHAGPSGGGVCGSYCESYCELTSYTCTGSNQLYADTGTCMTACAGLSAAGSPGDTSGDTVQCRIYHGGVPAAGDPTTHCPHAAEDGGSVCQ